MNTAFRQTLVFCCALCCAACATPRRDSPVAHHDAAPAAPRARTANRAVPNNAAPNGASTSAPPAEDITPNDIAIYAMGLVGTPYKYGGNTLDDGLDCSGFVDFVYQAMLNKHLPRTSREISHVGQSVEKTDLQPGDLVFFNTRHARYSHVGIYVGEGRFVHAPGRGKDISLAELFDNRYWRTRYEGARRLVGDSGE